jgi:hypothetical protein
VGDAGGRVRPFLERKGRAPKNFLEEVFKKTHLGILKGNVFSPMKKQVGRVLKLTDRCFMGIYYFGFLNKKNTPNIV